MITSLTAVKMAALIAALGVDTLTVASGLGMAGARGSWRIAATLALFEAGMPWLGLLAGAWLGRAFAGAGRLVAVTLLAGVGLYFLLAGERDEEAARRPERWQGWALPAAGLAVSLDELAVGLSLGASGLPLGPATAAIAAQAVVFTWVGLAFGRRLQPLLGEWAERAAGAVLLALAAALLMD
ncbi:MAG: manganese efflux pump [Firmicutes bacterium]|nr:manganese efflux pump [Bacillota bacterium]